MWSVVGEDEPLFSDMEEEENLRELDPHQGEADIDPDLGACYGGLPGSNRHLFNITQFKEAIAVDTDRELSEPLIDQRTSDVVRLALDDANPLPQEDYRFCIYDESLFNSDKYFEAVLMLAMGGYKKVTLDEETYHRYQRRVRMKWAGVDSLHDALMLLEGKCRPAFDMAAFLKKYPHWHEARRNR